MSSGRLYANGLANEAQSFERIRFGEQALDEAWLRDTLYAQPDLIPLEEAFPGTRGLSTVCTELPLADRASSLSLDVFGVTPGGRPVLVECKLWSNPEARRKVVAQILEYSTVLRTFSYGSLESLLKRKNGWSGENPLYHHVCQRFGSIDETTFVDNLTKSLAMGDFLLLIAGDGIRTDTQTLVQLLEETGMVGRLSMMEVKIWKDTTNTSFFLAPVVPTRVDVAKYRVYVDANNQPMQSEDVSQQNGETNNGIQNEVVYRRRTQQALEKEKAFWERVLGDLRFDNPDQQLPVYRHPSNARVSLPSPADWMTLFTARQKETGVFVVLEKNDRGFEMASALLAELDDIREEVHESAEIKSRQNGSAKMLHVSTYFDVNDPDVENKQIRWLRTTANNMINAVRPRLERFNADRL